MERIVYKKTYNSPPINKKDLLRYCGISEGEGDIALYERALGIGERLSYGVCYIAYPISVEGDSVDLGFTKTVSHSLARCLADCESIVLFCATVGPEIDRLVKKYTVSSTCDALLISGIGSERVESLCDLFCSELESKIGIGRLRPRFSPGYGDLSLSLQSEIFAVLDPSRRIGVSLGEDMFMTPSKSVTAIIGIKSK